MNKLFTQTAAGAALLLALVATADAQGRGGGGGGRRGPPESIRTRAGAFFVELELPSADAGQKKIADRVAASKFVEECTALERLSLVYLFDPDADVKKHERFEQSLFNHAEVNVALRLFKCARFDLGGDAEAKKAVGKRAPLFVAFDAKGKMVGEVSMKGYKASSGPLVSLLTKANKGYAKKVTLASFVKKYKSFLGDLTQLEGKKNNLRMKRERLEKKSGGSAKSKLAKLDKEDSALQKAEDKLMATETKLLENAKAPDRDPKAQRVGERQRGRRR